MIKTGSDTCPNCAFEGKYNELSEPYLTEEGQVQECPVHGRLFVYLHVYVTPEGDVFPLVGGSKKHNDRGGLK